MKRFLLFLLPLISAMQGFAYDLNDFINSCKEMPNATYSVMEGNQLHEIFNSLTNSPIWQNTQTNTISPDSLFRDVKKVDMVMFIDMNFMNFMRNKSSQNDDSQEANEAVTTNPFADVRAAALNIDGYEEYVYGAMTPAMTAYDQTQFDALTAKLTEAQKEEFKELMNNSFKMAIFGERTPELEYKKPIIIISLMGLTNVVVMDGIVPIVNIDSWVNSLQF